MKKMLWILACLLISSGAFAQTAELLTFVNGEKTDLVDFSQSVRITYKVMDPAGSNPDFVYEFGKVVLAVPNATGAMTELILSEADIEISPVHTFSVTPKDLGSVSGGKYGRLRIEFVKRFDKDKQETLFELPEEQLEISAQWDF